MRAPTSSLALLLVLPLAMSGASADLDHAACGQSGSSTRASYAVVDAWSEGCTGALVWSPILYCGGAEAHGPDVHVYVASGWRCPTGVVVERELPSTLP